MCSNQQAGGPPLMAVFSFHKHELPRRPVSVRSGTVPVGREQSRRFCFMEEYAMVVLRVKEAATGKIYSNAKKKL